MLDVITLLGSSVIRQHIFVNVVSIVELRIFNLLVGENGCGIMVVNEVRFLANRLLGSSILGQRVLGLSLLWRKIIVIL